MMADSKNTLRSVLSREQAARNGDLRALPDKLKPTQIAALEYPDDPDGGNTRLQFCNALQKAIDREELKTSGQTDDIYLTTPPTVVQRPLISRANYRQFLESIGADPSPGVADWLDGIGGGPVLSLSTGKSESVVPAAQSRESLLEERKACLAKWLEARSIPPEDWRSLGTHGLSIKAIYTAMAEKREFRSLSGIGDPVTPKTFERQFWKEQSMFRIR